MRAASCGLAAFERQHLVGQEGVAGAVRGVEMQRVAHARRLPISARTRFGLRRVKAGCRSAPRSRRACRAGTRWPAARTTCRSPAARPASGRRRPAAPGARSGLSRSTQHGQRRQHVGHGLGAARPGPAASAVASASSRSRPRYDRARVLQGALADRRRPSTSNGPWSSARGRLASSSVAQRGGDGQPCAPRAPRGCASTSITPHLVGEEGFARQGQRLGDEGRRPAPASSSSRPMAAMNSASRRRHPSRRLRAATRSSSSWVASCWPASQRLNGSLSWATRKASRSRGCARQLHRGREAAQQRRHRPRGQRRRSRSAAPPRSATAPGCRRGPRPRRPAASAGRGPARRAGRARRGMCSGCLSGWPGVGGVAWRASGS